MRHLDKLFILLTLLIFIFNSALASVSGKIDYQIPIDYTKLNKDELEERADFYYAAAIKTDTLSSDTTYALILYNVLSEKEPNNIKYLIRLGNLYDIIGKDRYAKGNYFHAIGINPQAPESFFSLAEFYYKRELYKKALKFYKLAYEKGYNTHYQTLYKIGDIYQKFGDTKNAIKYLQVVSELEYNTDLNEKLYKIQNEHNTNKEYYK